MIKKNCSICEKPTRYEVIYNQYLFDYNNKTYSLMHNGTIDKTIQVTLLTNNNSDSTWINNNPPNTYNNYNWSSDSGWVNIVDSELLLLWIMQNIELNENSELESIIHSIQELEAIHPNSGKEFYLDVVCYP